MFQFVPPYRRLVVFAIIGALPICAVVVGCSKPSDGRPEAPAEQKALADEIKGLGGLAAVDRRNPELGIVSVDLTGTKADDALVEKLAALPELKRLNLTNVPVTNAIVGSIKKMSKLEALNVSGTKISQAAIDALAAHMEGKEFLATIPDEPSAPE